VIELSLIFEGFGYDNINKRVDNERANGRFSIISK
jgi:hypothetical protein